MLHMMRNSVIYETKLVDDTVKDIGERLPPGWNLRSSERGAAVPSSQGFKLQVDAILEIRAPDGISSEIMVETKLKPVQPNVLSSVESHLEASARARREQNGTTGPEPVSMLISPYLSPLTRKRLTEAGISYADSTGNIRLSVERPAVFVHNQGADKNPIREKRPLRSLKGGRTARVVRALMDYRTPFGTRELAAETGCSPAMVSRVVNLLESDDIVGKQGRRGRIVSVDWQMLANIWAEDYEFSTSNVSTTWLEPRGTAPLLTRLRRAEFRYAITGSLAANRLAPFAEPRLVSIYADDPLAAGRSLDLRPAETGANVSIVHPFDAVAVESVERADGVAYARVTQVLLDLMKGPGRGPAEAEALLEWMKNNEDRWKLELTKRA